MSRVMSTQHPLVKHLVHLRLNKDYRQDKRSVVVTGRNLIEEIRTVRPFKTLLVEEGIEVPESLQSQEAIVTSSDILKKISGLPSPDGFVAEVEMPEEASLAHKTHILAFDAISDPGNVGTLMRTALALGWQGAMLLPGSCDPYNDKALRAAKGATFLLPWSYGSWEDALQLQRDNGMELLVADIGGEAIDEYADVEKPLLVLCNEGRGPSHPAADLRRLAIPMSGSIDSLNVAAAGAIILWSLRPPS